MSHVLSPCLSVSSPLFLLLLLFRPLSRLTPSSPLPSLSPLCVNSKEGSHSSCKCHEGMTFMPSPLLHCSSLPFCCCSPLFFLCSYPYTSSTSIFLANVYLSVYFSLFPFPFSFIHFSSLHSEIQGKKYIYNGHFSHSPHWPFFLLTKGKSGPRRRYGGTVVLPGGERRSMTVTCAHDLLLPTINRDSLSHE